MATGTIKNISSQIYTLGARVDIAGYTDTTPYTVPSDGYFQITASNASTATGRIASNDGSKSVVIAANSSIASSVCFVKKGFKISKRTSSGTAYFEYFPIEAI